MAKVIFGYDSYRYATEGIGTIEPPEKNEFKEKEKEIPLMELTDLYNAIYAAWNGQDIVNIKNLPTDFLATKILDSVRSQKEGFDKHDKIFMRECCLELLSLVATMYRGDKITQTQVNTFSSIFNTMTGIYPDFDISQPNVKAKD